MKWNFEKDFLGSQRNKAGLDICPYVGTYVRTSIHKKFLQFEWNLASR